MRWPCSARCRAASSGTWTRPRVTLTVWPAARRRPRWQRFSKKCWPLHPRHPGALHYLLHNYDDPEHARLALEAARAYATIAPVEPRAAHAGPHLLSARHVARRGRFGSSRVRRVHCVGQGAGACLRRCTTITRCHGCRTSCFSWAGTARRGRRSASIEPVVKVQRAAAIAQRSLVDAGALCGRISPMGSDGPRAQLRQRERAVRHRDERGAKRQRDARRDGARGLAERSHSEQEGDLRPAIAIMEREVAALIDLAAGRTSEAVDILQAAAKAELQLPAAPRSARTDQAGAGAARRNAPRTGPTARRAWMVRARLAGATPIDRFRSLDWRDGTSRQGDTDEAQAALSAVARQFRPREHGAARAAGGPRRSHGVETFRLRVCPPMLFPLRFVWPR